MALGPYFFIEVATNKKQIRVIVRDLKKFTERVVTSISLDITANLREDNPRDTGWSASNWLVEIGNRVKNPVGSKSSVDFGAQSSSLTKLIAEYRLDKGLIFISNPVSYIVALNEGSSKKAPAGYVQRAMIKGVNQTTKKIQ